MNLPKYRKIFWNIKTAFIGQKFVLNAPKQLLYFPVLIGLPLYTFMTFQSSWVYYDEYDGDVEEGKL